MKKIAQKFLATLFVKSKILAFEDWKKYSDL